MPLSEGQFQVRDLIMGPGTQYEILRGTNPFQMNVRADQGGPRAWNHGAWSGVEWLSEKVIPLVIRVRGATSDVGSWLDAHRTLTAAFAPVGESATDVEMRFMIGGTEYVMFGRPRMVEADLQLINSGKSITQAAFVALDPLVYAGAETVAGPIGLPEFTGGLQVMKAHIERTNYVLNPGAEVDATHAMTNGAESAPVARSTTNPAYGSASFEIVHVGGVGILTRNSMRVQDMTGPADGATCFAAVDVFVPSSVTANISNTQMLWRDDPNGNTFGNVLTGTIPVKDQWTRVASSFVVPAGLTTTSVYASVIFSTALSAGDLVRYDGWVVSESADQSQFDGDSPDVGMFIYAWTGTPHASTSTETCTEGLATPFTIDAVQVDGFADLTNAGTTETPLLLRIDGPVQEPSVTLQRADGTIQTLRFDLDLAVDQWLDIDTGKGTVLLQGTTSRRGQSAGDFPTLPPGGPHRLLFRAGDYNDVAALTITYRSAWWS